MKLARAAVCVVLVSGLARAQAPDTVTLTVGDPSIDGRYLTPHRAAMVVTVTKESDTVSSRAYTLDKFVIQRDGRRVFRLVLQATEGSADPAYYVESILDARTMAIIHREERDGTGRSAVYDVDGAHVTGVVRAARAAMAESVDVRLEQASFLSVFMDAAINAVPLRLGRVYHVPAFDIVGRRSEWHTWQVVRRDTVAVQGRPVVAWVIEEGATGRSLRRRIWMIREPPFFPLDITELRDGSVRHIVQTLDRVHS